jgi:Fe-S-cluster-containing hydrogenase component 2
MKSNVKSIETLILAVICVATLIALSDSCEVLDKRHLYAVSTPKCIGCKKCLSVCPQNAITIEDGKAVIDKQKCIGCGRCLRVCPASAVFPVTE